MRDIADWLSRDLESFCRWAAGRDGHCGGMALATALRDLIRMQAALDHLRLDQVELVDCPTLVVPGFLAAQPTLYVPMWLAGSLPTGMFELRGSFELVRPASLCWLLFEAVAITPADGFRTVLDLYGTRQ